MGGVIVDAGRSQSTNLGRDAYIHDHCLGYCHDYLLFYQLPKSNLSTHRMLFSREEPLVKTMAPRSIFYHIKILKIPCCIFPLFILLCIFVRSIYQIPYNLVLLIAVKGLATPCSRWVARICCFCAGVTYIVLLGSPTGLITLVLSCRKYLSLLYCIISSLSGKS